MRNRRIHKPLSLVIVATVAALTAHLAFTVALADSASRPVSASTLDRRTSTPIACIKQLPDGAPVILSRRCVTGVWLDHLYVEEADRSCGIKVIYDGFYPVPELQRGHIISLSGEMDTINQERVILTRSEIQCNDFQERSELRPVAMSMMGILGWPIPPENRESPRVTGLAPVGLFVRVWGRVTAADLADEEGYFVYIDDGWHLRDGSNINATGIRVYSSARPPVGAFIAATGVLGYKVGYDPTPNGPDGDEVIIPVVRVNYDQNPSFPNGAPVSPRPAAAASGRVRLVGQAPPGGTVRIYCESSSVVIEGVTNEFTPFTLKSVPLNGVPVSASAAGYISNTRIAHGGDSDIDFELEPAARCVEVSSDRDSISVCSQQSALITATIRDYEGRSLPNSTIKITTTRGIFAENGSKEFIGEVTEQGPLEVHLIAGGDGPGTAEITASPYPEGGGTSRVSVSLRGPQVSISADPQYITQAGTSAISAQVTNEGVLLIGVAVRFTTNHGYFVESGSSTYITTTNNNGYAFATLRIDNPGTAAVTAVYTNSCSHAFSNWIAVAYKSNPWFTSGFTTSNPLVVDLDGADGGKKEIVIANAYGQLMALSSAGAVTWSKTMHGTGTNTASCVVLDDGASARPCIYIPSDTQQKVLGFSHDGRTLAGWPAGSDFRFLTVAAAIGDINRDGSPEIVAGDECCYVFSWNPTGDWKKAGTWNSSFLWRNITASASVAISETTCALGDLDADADGYLDVAVGSSYNQPLFAFPGQLWGDYAYDPVYTSGYPKPAGDRMQSSPAIGDIDGDGKNDIAVGCNDGKVYIGLSSDQSWVGYPTGGQVKSSPALYDLDGDGKLDVIVGSASGKVFAFNWRGQPIEGWQNGIRLNAEDIYAVESSPVIGDVTGDGEVNIVVGCNDGNVYAIYKDGNNHRTNGVATGPIAWIGCCIPPNKTTARVQTSPAIDDLDADGKVDVVVAGTEGIYIFRPGADYSGNPAHYPWPTFHRDNQRTGCATPPPAPINASIQGYVTKNGQPVLDAKVYISYNDGSPVYEPFSNPPVPRSYVLTVGYPGQDESRKGAYCISQLPPNSTYKLTIEAPNQPIKVVDNISVTTGLVRVNIAL